MQETFSLCFILLDGVLAQTFCCSMSSQDLLWVTYLFLGYFDESQLLIALVFVVVLVSQIGLS